MANQLWLVAAVGLVMGITTVMAAIPGPNDPRYPDYIVNPPVTCNKEGSFPHPRNCSWYYRCVDRMKVGYYWTYHFECEPGTVFSDELDQCVHPFKAPYACKASPVTPEPPLKCEGVPGTCKSYDVCKPVKVNRTMCTEIRCPLRTPNLSCGDGYAFDMDTQECGPIPTAAELCPVLPLACEGVPGTCKIYDICRPVKVSKMFCDEIRCPLRQPNLSCGPGYSFDMKEQKCAAPPSSSQLCGIDITISDVGLLPCAYTGQIPKADFVVRKYCQDIPLCDGTTFQGVTQLCEGYYECEETPEGWKAHERFCPSGFLYSFDSGKCENIPTEEERC